MRTKLLACATVVAAVAAAGCGSSPRTAGQDTLTVAFNTGISTIDPAFACTTYDYAVVNNTYDNLVTFDSKADEDGRHGIVPAVAQSWKVSADKRRYTFKLRTDVKFSSGRAADAQDVVFSLKRLLAKGGCATYVLTTGDDKAIRSIRASAPDTVQIDLNRTDPLFLQLLAQTGSGIVDRKELAKHGGLSKRGDQWMAGHTAGTGPYTVERYEPDTAIELAARPGYWDGATKNKRVAIRIVQDATTLETLVNSGDVDLAYGVNLKDLASLKAGGKQILANPSQFFVYLGLNNSKPPFDDVRVRQAIRAALPVEDLEKRFGYGFTQTFAGPIPPATAFYPDLPVPRPDVARAKALLREAGVSSLDVTVDVKSGEAQQGEIATALQAALRPIGVKVRVATLGASAYSDKVFNYKSQAFLIKDGGTVNDPAYLLGFLVKCGDPYNTVKYCNRDVDMLLAEGRRESDEGVRRNLYRRVATTVDREAAILPIFAPKLVVVAGADVHGYVYYENQQPLFKSISVG